MEVEIKPKARPKRSRLFYCRFYQSKKGIHFIMQSSIVLPSLYAVAEDPPYHPRGNRSLRSGEMAEASFVVKAESLYFHVAKPWNHNNRYDFVLDSGKRLYRMQLKCTASIHDRAYQIKPYCRIHGKRCKEYTPEDIDFLVAYILPRDVWYLIPVAALKGAKSLRFYPDIVCKCAKWESYREAWHLLRDTEEPALA
jgi:hypothetical protein